MKDDVEEIEVGGHRITFLLKRSSRKTLGISVMPDGQVVVTAPIVADLEDIGLKVRKRAAWILNKQAESASRPLGLGSRRYLPGESHLFLGQHYRLRVDPDQLGTKRNGDRIIVGGVGPDEPSRIRNRLNRWYSREARHVFSSRLDECLPLFGDEIPRRPKLQIKPLEKRWGSYVSRSGTLILNRRLVEASIPQIDYVIVHELCHVIIPNHSVAFERSLSQRIPDWKDRKRALEALVGGQN